MQLVPDSWGSSLLESNDCHNPAGSPAGGQFCSGPGAGRAAVRKRGPKGIEACFEGDPEPLAKAMREGYPKMMEASFKQGRVHEVLEAYTSDGQRVATVEGQSDAVETPKEMQKHWRELGGVTVAHTHPSSGSFSEQDIKLMVFSNQIDFDNPMGGLDPSLAGKPPTTTKSEIVYAEDGSWFRMDLLEVPDVTQTNQIGYDYNSLKSTALRKVGRMVDKDVCALLGFEYVKTTSRRGLAMVHMKALGGEIVLDRIQLGRRVKLMGADPDKILSWYWRDLGTKVWRDTAARHPTILRFRSSLAKREAKNPWSQKDAVQKTA